MVESVANHGFNVCEIAHHTIGIELLSRAIDSDNPVVTVQIGAFAFVTKCQFVTRRHLK